MYHGDDIEYEYNMNMEIWQCVRHDNALKKRNNDLEVTKIIVNIMKYTYLFDYLNVPIYIGMKI